MTNTTKGDDVSTIKNLNTLDPRSIPFLVTEDGATFQEVQVASPGLLIAHAQGLLDEPDPNLADAIALLALAAGDVEVAPSPRGELLTATSDDRVLLQPTRR